MECGVNQAKDYHVVLSRWLGLPYSSSYGIVSGVRLLTLTVMTILIHTDAGLQPFSRCSIHVLLFTSHAYTSFPDPFLSLGNAATLAVLSSVSGAILAYMLERAQRTTFLERTEENEAYEEAISCMVQPPVPQEGKDEHEE